MHSNTRASTHTQWLAYSDISVFSLQCRVLFLSWPDITGYGILFGLRYGCPTTSRPLVSDVRLEYRVL